MNSMIEKKLALHHLLKGVIAHPSDTVYGLACLANNPRAIKELIDLKQRDLDKGFILLASDIEYLLPYIDANLDINLINRLGRLTSVPTTYLVPKSESASSLISGSSDHVAVRITADPLVRYFCENSDSALISTSANLQGKKIASSVTELKGYFNDSLSYVLPPNKYNSEPSIIIDLVTGKRYR